jgi:hypothetical protein
MKNILLILLLFTIIIKHEEYFTNLSPTPLSTDGGRFTQVPGAQGLNGAAFRHDLKHFENSMNSFFKQYLETLT